MQSTFIVRIKIEGLATRWVCSDIHNNLLTTKRAEARVFRSFQNASDAAGKWQRFLTGISALDFDVSEEEA